jgi:hypothetical protein
MNKGIRKQRELAGIEERFYPAPKADARLAIRSYNEALVEVRDAARHIELALKYMHEGSTALSDQLPVLKKYTQHDMELGLELRRKLTALEQSLTRAETNVRNFADAHPVPKKVWGLF